MKQCPACLSTFDDKVDFCFSDGTPLVAMDAGADPTALPGAADAATAESISDATTQVVPKPKRAKRGMFGRPSVADMLSVPVSASVPPAGGHRVGPAPSEDPQESQTAPTPAPVEAPAETQPSPVEPIEDTTVVEAVVDLPDMGGDDSVVSEPVAALDAPTPSIEVPVSPAVVELPETGDAQEEPTQAPPGFDAEETALDDSWFSDGIESDLNEDTQPLPEEPVEDPGFADVSDSSGGDAIGFDDSSWSAGGAVKTSAPVPKKLMLGGMVVLAACVMLTVLFSDDDPEPVSRVVATTPAPKAPPVEPPAPVEEAVEEEAPEEVEAELEEGVEEAVPVEAIEEEAADEEPAAPVPVPVPTPAPTESKPPPEAARTAEAPKAEKAAPPEAIPSPWTGAPAAETPAPAASNPWGAPTETPSRGRLTITTEPAGAMVFVDDRRIGKSPTRTEVDYGTHKIRVELADYKGTSRVVNVRASEVSVPFRLESERLIGKCILLGAPGSQVVMNGRSIGAIPVTVDCEPGSHSFKVTPPGGASFTASRSVSFARSGETANVFLTP